MIKCISLGILCSWVFVYGFHIFITLTETVSPKVMTIFLITIMGGLIGAAQYEPVKSKRRRNNSY